MLKPTAATMAAYIIVMNTSYDSMLVDFQKPASKEHFTFNAHDNTSLVGLIDTYITDTFEKRISQ